MNPASPPAPLPHSPSVAQTAWGGMESMRFKIWGRYWCTISLHCSTSTGSAPMACRGGGRNKPLVNCIQ